MLVILARDPFDPETWERSEVESVRDYLCGQFQTFPDNARIYNGTVSQENDVTPEGGSDGVELETLAGPIYVVCYPGAPIAWVAIASLIISIGLTAYTYFSQPSLTNASNNVQSSTNALSDRQNTARPKQRILDLYGTKRLYPDLLQVPYKIFENGVEVEYCLMCASRGELSIDKSSIKDGDTLISDIDGVSVAFYGPYSSPRPGGTITPQLLVGNAISPEHSPRYVYKSNSVNGQEVLAPNSKRVPPGYYTLLKFKADYVDGVLRLFADYDTDIKIESIFETGDIVKISGASSVTDGTHTVNLNGSYTIYNLNSSDDIITLTPFSSVSSAVSTLYSTFSSRQSNNITTADIYVDVERVIGPYTVRVPAHGGIYINLVAQQGLYLLDGGNQKSLSLTFKCSAQYLNSSGVPVGNPLVVTHIMQGSATEKSLIGDTVLIDLVNVVSDSNWAVSVECVDNLLFDGKTYVRTVQWRDLYVMSPAVAAISVDNGQTRTHFGNITMVQTRTPATPSALGLKERKFNFIATRKVPARVGTTSTFGALTASNNAADIFCAMALDPYVGKRNISELDVSNIYNTCAAIVDYFGFNEACEFSHAFDDMSVTWEETAKTIASAIYCEAYRQGSVTKLFFERKNSDSALLFNHRNKFPNENVLETRAISFGTQDNCDGIEFAYIDSDDDTETIFYVPEDKSAIKPQSIKSTGVRNTKQAHVHAYRAWNKLLYKNTTSQFTALSEAALITRLDRVLNADNTRSDVQDGEILEQNILTLTLSQPFEYSGSLNHSICLQLYDGSVQSIDIVSRDASNHRIVTIAEAPTLPLVLDDDKVRTAYIIVGNSGRSNAFLVDEKTQEDLSKYQLTLYNYDERYYANDKDFA